MLRRKTAILLCLIMVFTCFHISFAAKFSDIDEKQYSWAITQINEMSDKGIINGYPDGTFGPANGITKIEAMLLVSRILGINSDTYSSHLKEIYNLYAEDLDDLNLQYEKEIAFLIYKNIFSVSEIKTIVHNNELASPLKRDEVAVYLTKALGKYEDVKENGNSATGYADEKLISTQYRPFVKFVKDEQIMLGMTATTFEPNFTVNRAQMAVMLHRVMDKQNMLIFGGTLLSVDSDKKQIKVDLSSNSGSYDLTEADFIVNGESVKVTDIKLNSSIILVFADAVLVRVESFYEAPVVTSTVTGEVKEVILSSDKTVKLSDSLSGTTKKYTIDENCELYVGNNKSTLSLLRVKDHAKLHLNSDNEVLKIEILDTTIEFSSGIIKSISVNEDLFIKIERSNGVTETYTATDDVIVKRNSTQALLKDILAGDQITRCVTTYNRITRLEVKSEIKNNSGTISEILISSDSSVVVNKSGTKTRYPLSNSVEIFVDGKVADIYSLRLDMNINITTDSGVISKIEVTSVEDVGQLSGKVTLVNSSYGFVNILLASGETKQVFVSTGTKITADGATTATKTIKNINVNDYLVIIGKTVNGAFQATTIVIVAQ